MKIELYGHVYELVTKIPKGFHVWNIGDNMGADDLIPICERVSNDRFSDDYWKIKPETLKAIRLSPDDVKILRDAAMYGVRDFKTARALVRGRGRNDYYGRHTKETMNRTLEIFEEISE